MDWLVGSRIKSRTRFYSSRQTYVSHFADKRASACVGASEQAGVSRLVTSALVPSREFGRWSLAMASAKEMSSTTFSNKGSFQLPNEPSRGSESIQFLRSRRSDVLLPAYSALVSSAEYHAYGYSPHTSTSWYDDDYETTTSKPSAANTSKPSTSNNNNLNTSMHSLSRTGAALPCVARSPRRARGVEKSRLPYQPCSLYGYEQPHLSALE